DWPSIGPSRRANAHPDGRFTAAAIGRQIVIRDGSRPERRYDALYYTSDADLAWLDDTTILQHLSQPTGDVQFYTLDARTGRRALLAVVCYEEEAKDHPRVTDFGVSAAGGFWYTT